MDKIAIITKRVDSLDQLAEACWRKYTPYNDGHKWLSGELIGAAALAKDMLKIIKELEKGQKVLFE